MLLLQNLALVAQSMGLGGWIHAAFETSILLGGHPDIGPGLGFASNGPGNASSRGPTLRPRRIRSGSTACSSRAPPYFKDTDAVDAIIAEKYGPSGLYRDGASRTEYEA